MYLRGHVDRSFLRWPQPHLIDHAAMLVEYPLGDLRDGIGRSEPDGPVLAAGSGHLVEEQRGGPPGILGAFELACELLGEGCCDPGLDLRPEECASGGIGEGREPHFRRVGRVYLNGGKFVAASSICPVLAAAFAVSTTFS